MTQLVAAIVLSYNAPDLVIAAVESLLSQTDLGGSLEVIVVDNGSAHETKNALTGRWGTRVRMEFLPSNLGWGGGNNRGIAISHSKHVFVLNQDATVTPGAIGELVRVMETSDRIGMVAPKLMDARNPNVIDTAGHLMYADGLNRGRGRLETDMGQYDATTEALFPSGAAALYRRAMIDDIGPFDETLFLYGDDAEYGLRARRMGWECAFAPGAVAHHLYSASVGAYSRLKAFHVERNRLIILVKHFPLLSVMASPAYSAARFALQAWGAVTGVGAAGEMAKETGTWSLASTTLQAWLAFLRVTPSVLRARKEMRRRARVKDAEFARLLDRHRLSLKDVALKA